MLGQLEGFFDELEKIGSGKATSKAKHSGFVDAVIRNISTNPVKYYAAGRRHEEGKERHRRTMEALEHPYPASWVPLGMRPR